MQLAVYSHANAQNLESEVEHLLFSKDYTSAKQKLEEGLKGRKKTKAFWVRSTYDKSVSWLKKNDDANKFLSNVEKDLSSYKVGGRNTILQKGCVIGRCEQLAGYKISSGFPKSTPFSKEFNAYMTESVNKTVIKFNLLTKDLIGLAEIENNRKVEEKRIAELKRKERFEKERSARELQDKKKRKEKSEYEARIKNEEYNRLDSIVKSSGYEGYVDENMISFIYRTQKEGGLESYLGKVIGCNSLNKNVCTRSYPKVRVSQVIPDGVVYSFHEYVRGDFLNFTILVNKETEKIYQEGQALENELYAFDGMYDYQTILGVQRSIPKFTRILRGE